MTTKVDASSSAEAQNVQFTDLIPAPSVVSVPKVSMFAAKAGFVIPKNKLSGSLVPILRGGGKVGGKTVEEDVNEQVRRKTKWGPDLTVDPAVRKGRALAYRTRLEQITQQLKSRALDMKDNLGSESPSKDLNNDSASQSSNNEITNLELLELERRVIIGEIMCLNPSYKAPSDYTPLLKEAKIPIPPKVHPGRNFIALLLGPASNTQRRLEEETGAKVRVYGTKKETGKMHEITQQSAINEADESYEELYVTVSAETYEKVDAAVALIELLLAPVSQGNIAVLASSSGVSDSVTMNGPNLNEMGLSYTMMPMPDVNRGSTQTLLATSVPGQTEYQSYAASWYPNAQPSGGLTSSAPINSVTFSTPPFSGTSVSPYGGPPFGINLGNSPVTFRPPVPMQFMQQPVPQFVPSENQSGQQHPPLYPVMPPQPSSAMPHTSQLMFSGKIASGSTGPPNLQLTSGSPTSPSPNRLLSMQPLGSPGWSTSSQVVTSSQRPTPPFAASTMRPNIPVPPSAISSIPSPNIAPRPLPAMLSQPNNLVNISSKPSPANFSAPPQFPSQPGANFSASPQFPSQPDANFSASPQFPSQPGASPSFGLMPQRGPVSASAGAPFAMPRPASSLLPSSMVVPRPPLVPAPPFLTPGAPVTPQTYQALASFNPVIPIMGQPPASPLSVAQAPTPAQFQMLLPESSTSVPSIGGIHGFSLAQERTNMNNTPIKGPRPPLPISNDFTFQPLGVQVSHSGNSSMPNSQSAKQLPTSMAAPQPPSFRPCIHGQGLPVGNHGFASPQVSNPAPLPSATLSSNPPCIEPPLSHHFSYANTIRPLSLSSPIGPPSFSSVSQISNLPAARPHFLQPNQNQLLPAMRANTPRNSSQHFGASTPFLNDRVPRSPGVSQIYDPFSPTSASTARKQEDNTSKARTKETDAEYEDLMASVGVK